jgi:hypothetical protein
MENSQSILRNDTLVERFRLSPLSLSIKDLHENELEKNQNEKRSEKVSSQIRADPRSFSSRVRARDPLPFYGLAMG